jgi:hypothetical protein
VGSVASRNSWTFSASADSPMPANHSVRETMEPSLRLRIRGSSVSSNMPRISEGTPGSVAKSVPSCSRRAPIAVPRGLGMSSVPLGKSACL